jgi:hypothetical protein
MVVGTKEGFSSETVRLSGELLIQGPKLAEIAAVVVIESGAPGSVPGNEPAAAFNAALNVNVSEAPLLSFSEGGDTVTPEGSPVTVMAAPSPMSIGEDTWTVIVCEDPGVSVSELLEDVRVT